MEDTVNRVGKGDVRLSPANAKSIARVEPHQARRDHADHEGRDKHTERWLRNEIWDDQSAIAQKDRAEQRIIGRGFLLLGTLLLPLNPWFWLQSGLIEDRGNAWICLL